MRTKRFIALSAILIFLVSLTACGTKYYGFVLMAGNDNGFVAASRTYLGIDGPNVNKINKRQYEKLTLGNSRYANANPKTYTFDATAPDSDPANWNIVANQFNPDVYDTAKLVDDLKAMGVSFTGDIYICLTTFANYRVIEVVNTVNNVRAGSQTSMFMDDVLLNLPKGIDLNNIRRVYVAI